MSEKKSLIGLVPYQEKDSSVFFGREKEVENLLQIIQKNKWIQMTKILCFCITDYQI